MPPGHSSFLNSFHFEKNCHRKFYQGHRLPKLLFHLLIYFNFGPISSFFMNYIDHNCLTFNIFNRALLIELKQFEAFKVALNALFYWNCLRSEIEFTF